MGSIEILEEAQAELEEAVRWYRERNRRAAISFVTDYRTAVKRIVAMPLTWPEDASGTRRVLFDRFPYKVVYRFFLPNERILLVAVAHQKREPGYWRLR